MKIISSIRLGENISKINFLIFVIKVKKVLQLCRKYGIIAVSEERILMA